MGRNTAGPSNSICRLRGCVRDRNYIICRGKVVVSGDAETVINDPTAQELYFGTCFDAGSIIEGKEAFDADDEEYAWDRAA